MTPKEKAFELYKMYNNIIIDEVIEMKITYLLMTNKMAKKSALIAVNKILESLEEHHWQNRHIIDNYKLVKQEIEKL